MSNEFFEEMTDASDVKSQIVSKYFAAWTKVMKSNKYVNKLGYIDLFAGKGRYDDGSPSTPIKVLEHIIGDEDLRDRFVTIFNDKDEAIARLLQEEIKNIPGINTLKYAPQVAIQEVNDDLVKKFAKTSLIPNLAFIDPFGYKGVSLKLIKGLTKDWGSDCIFFFNYNRISIGISNPKIENHINAIFGEERAERLREEIGQYTPNDKPSVIINALAEALLENGGNYVLPFKFMKGKRISHYLIFVTKHPLGYQIMKDIMWRESTDYDDGVANFSYIDTPNKQLEILFAYSRQLDSLGDDLMQKFSGRTLTTKKIFELHNINTPFVLPNYKEALKRLEAQGIISTLPPASARPKRKGEVTFSDEVSVTFP